MSQASLLDIAKLNNNDTLVGLVEENLTYAPELSVFPARTIRGTSYRTVIRTGYPNVAFRNANEGPTAGVSTFINKMVEAYILSANIIVDEAVAMAYEDGSASFVNLEAAGAVKNALIKVGSQVFYGISADSKGFPGLQAIVDSSLTVDAGGTTNSVASSVYGVKMGSDACQLVVGQEGQITLPDFTRQTISNVPSLVSSMTAWIGLQAINKNAILRLKKCTTDSGKGVTDALLAQLLSKAPIGVKPNYWFMSRRSAFQLQSSRSATTNNDSQPLNFAQAPTQSCGIPIIVTDSLVDTETLTQ